MDFAKVAPYLNDPLVLVGFVIFIGFLFARRLLSSGIIPPIGAGRGAQILRLLMHYGFIIGLAIVLLAFGLKYKSLSDVEQESAIGLLMSEVRHNAFVVGELIKNTETLSSAALSVAGVLRTERLRINRGLFPDENADASKERDPDSYNKRFDWLEESGLLSDETEMRRFREQNAAVSRSVARMMQTVKSLGDRQALRYTIDRSAYEANLPVLRKITLVNVSDLSDLYATVANAREKYFRIAESVEDYFSAVSEYTKSNSPDRGALGAVLAAEGLTIRLLPEQKAELETLAKRMEGELEVLKRGLNSSSG